MKPDSEKKDRTPFEISIVLDRSGSMAGLSLESCKTAIEKIIENLGSEDIVHFVVYDDKADLVFKNGNSKIKDQLIAQIKTVQCGGCTNLLGGLELGFSLISLDRQTHQKRIFLFSDGMVNSGVQDKSVIQNKTAEFYAAGVKTTSLGIGADYDEVLMKNIAEYGHGDYFFINEQAAIERIIDACISGLLWTVGTNAVVAMQGCNGALVKKVYNHKDLVAGAQLGDLKEDFIKQVVFEIEYGPSGCELYKPIHIATYVLNYDTKEGPQTHKGELFVTVVDDKARIGELHPKIEIAHCVAVAAEHDLIILDLLDNKKIEKAIALQEEHLDKLKKLNERIHDENGFFKYTLLTAEDSLTKMKKNKSDTKEAKKHVQYSNYMNCKQDAYQGYTYCGKK